MELFCFASNNLTNIWAGIGAGLWAVAETSESDMKARVTKSCRMKIGSLGVLYCSETHSFTTPFLVYSEPDPIRVVTDVWPERWRLPFRIHALGNPTRQVEKSNSSKRICGNEPYRYYCLRTKRNFNGRLGYYYHGFIRRSITSKSR